MSETAEESAPMSDEAEPTAAVTSWSEETIRASLEALLFASPEPLAFRVLRNIIPEDEVPTTKLREGLDALIAHYERDDAGVRLRQIAGGWQFQTREDLFPFVSALAKTRVEDRVSPAALETLAVIAYKQPITRAEIDAIRGVGSGSLIRTLMDKKMVKVVGRVDLPGRPFQYGTTPHFLEHFGLGRLKDLPQGREL